MPRPTNTPEQRAANAAYMRDYMAARRSETRIKRVPPLKDHEIPAVAMGKARRVRCRFGHSYILAVDLAICPAKFCGAPLAAAGAA